MYSNSVVGVDRQFGELLAMLERKGALNNAIVVVLSDHGEALGLAQDNLLYEPNAKQAARGVTVQMWGHGNSTLSPGQYQVLFAWHGFGAARETVGQGRRGSPSSLEDLMPTVLDLLDVPFVGEFDGLSLVPELQTGKDPARLGDRIRFTESGIGMGFTTLGDVKVDEIVKQGMSAYGINPENGRLELKQEFLADLIRSKERAAIGRTRILAAVPMPDGSTEFIVLPRSGGIPEFLDHPPALDTDVEIRHLWDALLLRFGDEISVPSAAS